MPVPFEEWWKRHIYTKDIYTPVQLSLSASGVRNLRLSFPGGGIHLFLTDY